MSGRPPIRRCPTAGRRQSRPVLAQPAQQVHGGLDVGAHGVDLFVRDWRGLSAEPAQMMPGGEGANQALLRWVYLRAVVLSIQPGRCARFSSRGGRAPAATRAVRSCWTVRTGRSWSRTSWVTGPDLLARSMRTPAGAE